MLVYWNRGVWTEGEEWRWVLDPQKTFEDPTYISHAHSDHAGSRKKEVLATEITAALLGRERVSPPAGVKLLNAGHIPGSSMVLLEDGADVLYTGDFKTEDDVLLKGAEPVEADILVVESTFGLPSFRFPRREEIYHRIERWIREGGKKALIGYKVGKAQELVALLNQLGIEPMVSPDIEEVNRKMVELGVKLAWGGDRDVVVASPRYMEALRLSGFDVRVASGWAREFPLSGHADFPHLLEFVEAVNPKRVYTVHGFSREFAAFLRKKGYDAVPLSTFPPIYS